MTEVNLRKSPCSQATAFHLVPQANQSLPRVFLTTTCQQFIVPRANDTEIGHVLERSLMRHMVTRKAVTFGPSGCDGVLRICATKNERVIQPSGYSEFRLTTMSMFGMCTMDTLGPNYLMGYTKLKNDSCRATSPASCSGGLRDKRVIHMLFPQYTFSRRGRFRYWDADWKTSLGIHHLPLRHTVRSEKAFSQTSTITMRATLVIGSRLFSLYICAIITMRAHAHYVIQ
jgi:hypothetical protein